MLLLAFLLLAGLIAGLVAWRHFSLDKSRRKEREYLDWLEDWFRDD